MSKVMQNLSRGPEAVLGVFSEGDPAWSDLDFKELADVCWTRAGTLEDSDPSAAKKWGMAALAGYDFLAHHGAPAVAESAAENAAALGFKPRPDEFNARVSTANGPTSAAPIQLDSLSIGTITERNVNAMVARPGALSGNLLGQTFLDRLASYEVRGNRLILTPEAITRIETRRF